MTSALERGFESIPMAPGYLFWPQPTSNVFCVAGAAGDEVFSVGPGEVINGHEWQISFAQKEIERMTSVRMGGPANQVSPAVRQASFHPA